jgi:hypothetical protein
VTKFEKPPALSIVSFIYWRERRKQGDVEMERANESGERAVEIERANESELV